MLAELLWLQRRLLAGGSYYARDFLKELGVRPIINGAGVYTFTTASLMRPEVVDAIQGAEHEIRAPG